MHSCSEYAMTATRSQDAQSVPHVILKSQLLSSKEIVSSVLLIWGQSRGRYSTGRTFPVEPGTELELVGLDAGDRLDVEVGVALHVLCQQVHS